MDDTTAPACKECGSPLIRKGRGPAPTYCSANCRARAKDKRARIDGRYAAELAASRAANQATREANAKPCPYCGDLMEHPRRVQCGKPECKRLWTNERSLAYQRDHKDRTGQYYSHSFRYDRICASCGQTWAARKSDAQYCSISCANSGRAYERTCEHCGTTWTAKVTTARWCSDGCRAGVAIPGTAVAIRQPKPWWARQAWISPRPPRHWYAGYCRRCSTSFISDQPANSYCSKRCLKADTKDRARARKRNAYVEHVYRQRVFERDRWTCQLCKLKVNRRAVVPHPQAPVIDHVIPLADGGTHEPANVQCAHFICNSAKGARGGGEQLALIG